MVYTFVVSLSKLFDYRSIKRLKIWPNRNTRTKERQILPLKFTALDVVFMCELCTPKYAILGACVYKMFLLGSDLDFEGYPRQRHFRLNVDKITYSIVWCSFKMLKLRCCYSYNRQVEVLTVIFILVVCIALVTATQRFPPNVVRLSVILVNDRRAENKDIFISSNTKNLLTGFPF